MIRSLVHTLTYTYPCSINRPIGRSVGQLVINYHTNMNAKTEEKKNNEYAML